MLMKDRQQRLGQNNDLDDILMHPFFKGLDIEALLQKKIKAPFIPSILHNRDLRHFDQEVTGQGLAESILPPQSIQEIKTKQQQGAFDNFGPVIGSDPSAEHSDNGSKAKAAPAEEESKK